MTSLTTARLTAPKIFCCQFFYLCFHSLLKSEFVYRTLDCIILLGSNWIFWTKAERLVRFHKSQWKLCFADTTKSHALSYFWLCYREKSFFPFLETFFFRKQLACLLPKENLLWRFMCKRRSITSYPRPDKVGYWVGLPVIFHFFLPSPLSHRFTVRSRFSAWLYLLLWRTKTKKKLTEKKNTKKSTATYIFWLYNSCDSCDAWWTVPAPPT